MTVTAVMTAVILGIVEGLTEFIPVSSTGHLILAGTALGFEGPAAALFEVVIQLGAILAVCWAYRKRLWSVVTGLPSDPAARRFAATVLLAFLPAAVVGALAHHIITTVLFSPRVVAASLVVGGIAIILIERVVARRPALQSSAEPPGDVGYRTAFLIGLCQLLALIPGVSRAGATIMGAVAIGVNRRTATEFSFFLAIPTMFGASAFDLYKSSMTVTDGDLVQIAIGLVTSFLCALVVIRWLIGFVSRHGFTAFGWYRIALGLVVFALLARA